MVVEAKRGSHVCWLDEAPSRRRGYVGGGGQELERVRRGGHVVRVGGLEAQPPWPRVGGGLRGACVGDGAVHRERIKN